MVSRVKVDAETKNWPENNTGAEERTWRERLYPWFSVPSIVQNSRDQNRGWCPSDGDQSRAIMPHDIRNQLLLLVTDLISG